MTWDEWRSITQRIYSRRMNGWPNSEMKRYFNKGMSPLQAFEFAIRRRRKLQKEQP